MNDSLRKNLLERLQEYERKNQRLTVIWNAGGDDRVINFYLEGNELSYSDELMWALESYFIEEFSLPSAGEIYDDGTGELSIENGNRIAFKFDELAYFRHYNDDVMSKYVEEEFSITPTLSSQKLLDTLNQKELHFYGSTYFLMEELKQFRIHTPDHQVEIREEILEEVYEHISIHASSQFLPPLEGTKIRYSGTIKEDEILIEELYQIKHSVHKNKKGETIYLFE